MGPKSLASTMRVSREEAELLISNFFSLFPGRRRISALRDRQEKRARDNRQCVNYVIQGTASEIFKKALINIGQVAQDLSVHIVMVIHDEVIIECPVDELSHFRSILRTCMENVFNEQLLVPLRVRVTSGPNWGSLTD